ncbi:MAG: hypothetical protein AB7T06_40805 [Kofleriaceae bacterium]
MTAEQTARERVADWLGRGAPADELTVTLRRALRELIAEPTPDAGHVGVLLGERVIAERLPWPRDPVPGSEDDFASVYFDYELTVTMYIDGHDASRLALSAAEQSIFDPRLPMREQLAEDIAGLVAGTTEALQPAAMRLAYGPTGAPRNASES